MPEPALNTERSTTMRTDACEFCGTKDRLEQCIQDARAAYGQEQSSMPAVQ
jgi:hypothetical protein